MKRSTLIFALLFAALLSYVYLVQKKQSPSTQQAPPGTEKVFFLKPDEIASIEIRKANRLVEMKRTGANGWMLEKPVQDWADRFQAENLADGIANLTTISSVSKEENVKEYGLGEKSAEITVRSKTGSVSEIRVGDESPTGQGYYAYLPEKGEIALVPVDFGQMAQRPPETWRDRLLLHFEPSDVRKIEIQFKGRILTIKKNGEKWSIVSPFKGNADSDKVSSILSEISTSHLAAFMPGGKFASDHPLLSVSLWETGSPKFKSLIIGEKTLKGYPATSSDRDYSFFMEEKTVKDLSANPASFKDLHLLSFTKDAITKIETIKGKEDYVFEKQGNDWKVTQPASGKNLSWKAGILLDDLKGLMGMELSTPPEPMLHPFATVNLWQGKNLISKVAIGERTARGGKTVYPVRILPGGQTSWCDASLLMKDFPMQ